MHLADHAADFGGEGDRDSFQCLPLVVINFWPSVYPAEPLAVRLHFPGKVFGSRETQLSLSPSQPLALQPYLFSFRFVETQTRSFLIKKL